MAEPYTGPGLIGKLRRQQGHMKDIARVLHELKRRLDELEVPFAVVGATAMYQYGYVRATEDLDLLTTKAGLDRIHEKLVGLGYVARGPKLRKSLRETEHHVNIDVITAGEHAGSSESPLIFPDPSSDAFVEIDGVRYPRLERLIELKLVSGVWGNRPHDLGDVFNLIKANRLDASFAGKLIPEVRGKFQELFEQTKKEVTLE